MSKKNILDYMCLSERSVQDDHHKENTKRAKSSSNLDDLHSDLTEHSSSQYDTQDTLSSEPPSSLRSSQQKEERFAFLQDIRDHNGRRPEEPGYDPSTLYISEHDFNKLSPFEKQFWSIKSQHYDTVILFKKGKFYELYEADAELVSKLFDFRMTDRVNMKMSGFPEKSYAQWASKLLELGYKIGRVEQAENAVGKRIRERDGSRNAVDKLVKRELTEIITSGTIYDLDYLSSSNPIYTGSLIVKSESISAKDGECYFISLLLYDASTNKIFYTEFEEGSEFDNLRTILVQHDVRELIVKRSTWDIFNESLHFILKESKIIRPDPREAAYSRKYDFPSDSLFICFKQLYNYMDDLCRAESLEFTEILVLEPPKSMSLDASTLTSLDILTNNYDRSTKHSLFSAINYCVTPMGERMLQRWLLSPLTDINKILSRHKESSLLENFDFSEYNSRIILVGDLERRLGRLNNLNPTLKSLLSLIESLKKSTEFIDYVLHELDRQKKSTLDSDTSNGNLEIVSNCDKLNANTKDMLALFEEAYRVEGDELVPGSSNKEIEHLSDEMAGIDSELQKYLESLKERLGNNDLCYKSPNKEMFQVEAPVGVSMPPEFSAVSMTKTHRRYYSPALKELVKRREESEERIFQARESMLRRAVETLKPFKEHICALANAISTLDCYASFSKFASSYPTCIPEFVDWNTDLQVLGMASPVYPRYVKNDFLPENRITLVTGPNMGGKSTFLRGVALNIILAQMGMRVMASRFQTPVFENIFTRIGASDSLARGESTFMKELLETSKILRHGTSRSFVIMDELGRGTSTEDGSAIARAVLDYLHHIGCYVLFSTHYHSLVSSYESVDKAYMDSLVDDGDIIFLYKVCKGVCLSSQGLEIAKLAGVPEKIVEAARRIKERLEERQNSP